MLTMRLTQPAVNAKRRYQPMMISVVSLDNKEYKNERGLDFPRNYAANEDNCNKERHLEVHIPSVQLHS